MTSREWLIDCWRYLCEGTKDIDQLGERMRVELGEYETFREVREECLKIWSDERDRRKTQAGSSPDTSQGG